MSEDTAAAPVTEARSPARGRVVGVKTALATAPRGLHRRQESSLRAASRPHTLRTVSPIPMRDVEEMAGEGVDLSDAVTVFVTTVGAATFDACLLHLRAQDCRFRLRVIAYVAPMHAAFQRMLDACRTPYYVQVDEDMLLDPDAVRTLHARIEACGPETALVVCDLYDEHLRRCIHGVKIFRHAIAARYSLQDRDAFEVRQLRAMEADGFRVVRTFHGETPIPGQTLGKHGTHWTPETIFVRYRHLEQGRLAEGKASWFEAHGRELFERFRRDPSELNFFALMGLAAGVLCGARGAARPRDYRVTAAPEGLAALREFLAACERVAITEVPNCDADDPTSENAR